MKKIVKKSKMKKSAVKKEKFELESGDCALVFRKKKNKMEILDADACNIEDDDVNAIVFLFTGVALLLGEESHKFRELIYDKMTKFLKEEEKKNA